MSIQRRLIINDYINLDLTSLGIYCKANENMTNDAIYTGYIKFEQKKKEKKLFEKYFPLSIRK